MKKDKLCKNYQGIENLRTGNIVQILRYLKKN